MTPPHHDAWRQTHVGHWLGLALQRFDARVLALMARNTELSLSLSHLAGRGRLTASHVHITRHLDTAGLRLTELATRAQMSKQAMGKLVDQCAAWGLVRRQADARDGRAQIIIFTPEGAAWLRAYQEAVTQAQDELHDAIGAEVATVMTLGLEAYAA